MNRAVNISAECLSASTGRPVRLFNSVCRYSGVLDASVLEECRDIIAKHNGSAMVAVHPGYYLMDNNRKKVLAGISSKSGKARMDDRYEEYRLRFEKLLKANRTPVFLFIEKHRGLTPYSWYFDHSRSDLTLVVETKKAAPQPIIGGNGFFERIFEGVFWNWTSLTISRQLGVSQALFTGEYLFVAKDGSQSGCVSAAHTMLYPYMNTGIDTVFTFPNSPRKKEPVL